MHNAARQITLPPIATLPPLIPDDTTTTESTVDPTPDTPTDNPDPPDPTPSTPTSDNSSLPSSEPPSFTSSFTPTSSPETSITPTPTPSSQVSESFTTVVTSVSGQLTTFTSRLPTSLADRHPVPESSERTAIIAGATTGVVILLLILLGGVFVYRRRKLRALEKHTRKKDVGSLLDGEGFDDDDATPMGMRPYHDRGVSYQHTTFPSSSIRQIRQDNAAGPPPTSYPYKRPESPSPSILKSRISDTGSIFREEVWPPPGFVDPIQKRSSQVDLSRIVEDVMGPSSGSTSTVNYIPSASLSHVNQQQFGSTSSLSHIQQPTDDSMQGFHHSRDMTDDSGYSYSNTSGETAFVTPPRNRPVSINIPISPPSSNSITSSYGDPFMTPSISASPPSSFGQGYAAAGPPNVVSPRPPSIRSSSSYVSLPPGASAPSIPGNTPTSSSRPSMSVNAPEGASHVRSKSGQNSQPKKSSPLARALSKDAKIWLGRNPT